DRSIVSLKRIDRVGDGHAVGTGELPVGGIAEQCPADPRSLYAAAALDRDDPPRAVWRFPDRNRRVERAFGFVDEFESGANCPLRCVHSCSPVVMLRLSRTRRDSKLLAPGGG